MIPSLDRIAAESPERRLRFCFSTRLSFTGPVRGHAFLLRCLPVTQTSQRVIEAQISVDGAELRHGYDAFGNCISWGLLEEEHAQFCFTAQGLVEIRPYRICAPLHPMYEAATSLTACTQVMRDFALITAGKGNDLVRTERLSGSLRAFMRYEAGSTHVRTTAAEAWASGSGVCQDYAHILIALCREAGIAARYVTGYMLGEGATHAWVEVYSRQDCVWYGLDPTNGCRVSLDHIKVGQGRDADDCPVSRGVMTGVAGQSVEISVKVQPAND